jgi:hypothetical protein
MERKEKGKKAYGMLLVCCMLVCCMVCCWPMVCCMVWYVVGPSVLVRQGRLYWYEFFKLQYESSITAQVGKIRGGSKNYGFLRASFLKLILG